MKKKKQKMNQNRESVNFDIEYAKECLPIKDDNADKIIYGKTLVIAGSADIYGACYFSAKASFLSGAGMVRIFTHVNNRHSLQLSLPEAMFSFYDKNIDDNEIGNIVSWADTLVIGPGISTSELAKRILVSTFDNIVKLKQFKILVIDADAINILAYNNQIFNKLLELIKETGSKCVITPHSKELHRLMTGFDYNGAKEDFCKMLYDKYSIVTVMKQHRTNTFGKNIYINMSGNEGMATAGSGDVLAGILGGMLKRVSYLDDFEKEVAACVFVHGLSGDIASYNRNSISVMASDIMDSIPFSFDRIQSKKP